MYCCFTGHRPENLPWLADENSPRCTELKKVLSDIIEQSILDGYTDFYCGMARGIDTFAAQTVIQKAALYPEIKLHAALPCPNQSERWNKKDKIKYDELLSRCYSKTVISPYYTDTCMLNRNRFMVENSQRIIAVWNGYYRGGTAYTVRYAKQCKREILLIRPKDFSVTVI